MSFSDLIGWPGPARNKTHQTCRISARQPPVLGCLVAYGVTRANASKGTLRPLADPGYEVRSLLQRTQARADRARNRVGEIRAGWYHGTLAETSEHVANALGSKWDEIVVAGFRASNAAWWQSWRYTLSVVPRFGALQS